MKKFIDSIVDSTHCNEAKDESNFLYIEEKPKRGCRGGMLHLYPNCKKSKIFASISGRTTLTEFVIELIKELGYQVNITSSPFHKKVS